MDQAARGAAALAASNYEEAISQYTKALSTNPNAVDYYIKRSTAYQRSAKYPEALADAEIAVVLAHKRARRELIKDAQLRRGIALFFHERYADAEFVFNIVKKLDDKEKTLHVWIGKVAAKTIDLPEDDERRKLSCKEVPDVELPSEKAQESSKVEAKAEPVSTSPKPVVPTPANKIKHDWYQNSDKVYFTLLAKGVPKDKAEVLIEKDSLSISFPIQDASDFGYTLDPFYASVDPSQSTFRITPTKIEVTLKKETPGVRWHGLEGVDNASQEEKPTIPTNDVVCKNASDRPPAYPTSSKTGAKDWDKVAKDALKSGKKTEHGAMDMEEEEGDETTRFFRTLYKDASPETQRAMMKSYSESGGTVLSTDWKDVGSKTVVPEPPEGMVAKKY
ncbi:SGS-domain-containing protein [Pleomassaria siparia CBS 279.74]|uniref:SGS-domain-containing protein n=1 Tax=Pleomassaria siparia CBS 279.74 TaxID=1314801 RepID=A0A6G1JR64_9PLEO|nr:SGS-domain-containing protein [Pleomassaria siparia CBS 279.74]